MLIEAFDDQACGDSEDQRQVQEDDNHQEVFRVLQFYTPIKRDHAWVARDRPSGHLRLYTELSADLLNVVLGADKPCPLVHRPCQK